MGQKVSPISFRLGYTRGWESLWYANKKTFAKNLLQDMEVREHILKNFKSAAVSRVVIEREAEKIRINVHTARPGVIIGRRGADIDRLRDDLMAMIGKEVQINIHEIKNPSADAQLLAENVALQLEKRIAFRRAMKKIIQQAKDSGVKGIKIFTKGRLGGSEIARKEGYLVGSLPLHTLRAEIDYGFAEAMTTYGKIGVKVWLHKGEKIGRPDIFNLNRESAKEEKPSQKKGRPQQDAPSAAPGNEAGGNKPAAETSRCRAPTSCWNASRASLSAVARVALFSGTTWNGTPSTSGVGTPSTTLDSETR